MISDFAAKYKLPSYRIKQFDTAFYGQAITSFDELTTWSKQDREKLVEEVPFTSLEVDREFVSNNQNTIKVLFTRKVDGQRIETVLMRHDDGRNTVCVSCMVGCPVNCSFCATGKMGYGGSLSATEIIDQIMHFQRFLKPFGQKVSNVVFMGMGEPLLNLEQVQQSIDIMTHPDKLGMSTRRITISTSGYIPQFKTLVQNGFRGRVAISLHASNQPLREKLMPVAKIYSLDDLMQTLDDYVELTNKRVSYEYIMIKNVNDTPKHAEELIELLSRRLAHVNLIPFNPIKEESFERSGKSSIYTFADTLRDAGIPTTIRVTMGDDVDAACGQLADRENKKHVEKRLRI